MTDLSPAGLDRKGQMLDVLQRRVTARRRRRRAVAVSASALPLIAIGLIITIASRPTSPPTGATTTSPAKIQAVTFERIDDDELLDLLREADRPGGLIRKNGVTTVTFTDPDRGPIHPGSG